MPVITITGPSEGFVVSSDTLVITGSVASGYGTITVQVTRPEERVTYRVNVVSFNFSVTVPIARGTSDVPLTIDAYEASTPDTSIDHATPVHGTIAAAPIPPGTKLFSVPVINNTFSVTAPITQGQAALALAIRAFDGATPETSTVLSAPVYGTIAAQTTPGLPTITITDPKEGYVLRAPFAVVSGTTTGNLPFVYVRESTGTSSTIKKADVVNGVWSVKVSLSYLKSGPISHFIDAFNSPEYETSTIFAPTVHGQTLPPIPPVITITKPSEGFVATGSGILVEGTIVFTGESATNYLSVRAVSGLWPTPQQFTVGIKPDSTFRITIPITQTQLAFGITIDAFDAPNPTDATAFAPAIHGSIAALPPPPPEPIPPPRPTIPTWKDFIDKTKGILFPERESLNLAANHTRYILDGMIWLQRRIPCLQERHYDAHPFEDTYYKCCSSMLYKPDGVIKRIFVFTTADQCDAIYYQPVTKPALMSAVRKQMACGACPPHLGSALVGDVWIPENPTPEAWRMASTETDKGYRSAYGVWTVDFDKLLVFPHLDSFERLGVEWSGIKLKYEDDDPLDFPADIQPALELYVLAQVALREECDTQNYQKYWVTLQQLVAELIWYCRKKMILVPETDWRGNTCEPCALVAGTATTAESFTTFVAFGDSGLPIEDPDNADADQMAATLAVSKLVRSLSPDFVIHLGDTCYPAAIEPNLTNAFTVYYQQYIPSRMWLAVGNRDLDLDGGQAIKATLPYVTNKNPPELYYTLTKGSVDFFFLNTGKTNEGLININSPQIAWLQAALEEAKTTRPNNWRIVCMHKPEKTATQEHAGDTDLPKDLDLAAWGVDMVLSGHGHAYEHHHDADGLHSFIAGTGGAGLYEFQTPIPSFVVKAYNSNYGCLKVAASTSRLLVSFYTINEEIIETVEIVRTPVVQPIEMVLA